MQFVPSLLACTQGLKGSSLFWSTQRKTKREGHWHTALLTRPTTVARPCTSMFVSNTKRARKKKDQKDEWQETRPASAPASPAWVFFLGSDGICWLTSSHAIQGWKVIALAGPMRGAGGASQERPASEAQCDAEKKKKSWEVQQLHLERVTGTETAEKNKKNERLDQKEDIGKGGE